jgi:23S rRNA pseudouridine1911/1915/1917 synthase
MGEENTILTGTLGEGRLDRALASALPQLSRARIQSLVGDGALHIGGKAIAELSSRKFANREFTFFLPATKADKAEAQQIALNIAFEDEHLLIVDKPAGMVVHPSAGHADGTLVNALLFHCKGQLSGIGGVERPGIVHRIDRGTSGLLAVAKSDAAHQGLAKQFANHDIHRRYLAIVRGTPAPPAGVIRTQIGRSRSDRKKMAVLSEGFGKHAVTHFRTLENFSAESLVQCTLETGRTHQVRVHMTHIGHPLIGDATYGNRQKSYLIGPNQSKFERQALHAAELGFIHPVTNEKLQFKSNLPDDMQELLSQLRV